VFRRSSAAKDVAEAPPAASVPAAREGQVPKGRATPSRKEAEAARKYRLGAPPSDPKAARRLAREQQRASFERSRQAMKTGDTRYYPVRDQGPARAFARDYVDGRLRLLEFVMPAVALSWLSLVVRSAALLVAGTVIMYGTVLVAVGCGVVLQFRIKRAASAKYPNDIKGLGWYAVSRAVMPRPLRQPKPKVTFSGKTK
jgi:hypothetical protein